MKTKKKYKGIKNYESGLKIRNLIRSVTKKSKDYEEKRIKSNLVQMMNYL